MATAVRKTNVAYVWPEQLIISKTHRDNFGNIDELGKSIVGIKQILQALKVKKTDKKTEDGFPMFRVIIGNRRGMASQRIRAKMIEVLTEAELPGAEGDFVPIEIFPDTMTDAEVIAASIIADEQTKPRSLFELGRDMKLMADGGMKQKAIAKMIGKSDMYVSDGIMLVERATPEIVRQLTDGTITPYAALDLIKAAGEEAAEEIITTAANTKKTKEEAVGAAPGKKKSLSKTELKEAAAGKPISVKDKSKASKSAGDAKVAPPAEKVTAPKVAAGVAEAKQLLTSLEANAGDKKPLAFGMLKLLINYLAGKATALDVMPHFFYDMDEEADEQYEALHLRPEPEAKPVAKKKAAEVPAKPVKGVKAKATPVEEDEDEEEVKPAKKSAKPAPKAAGKKKPVADEDEDEVEIEEDLDLDEEDEEME